MSLTTFLQGLCIEPLHLIVDNARSPACPVSRACARRRRNRRRTSTSKRVPILCSRWGPEPSTDEVSPISTSGHAHKRQGLCDTELHMPARLGSCEITDTMIQDIFATLTVKVCDAAPIMPTRIAASPVPSRRILRLVLV
jgi:hypothetical protein